MIIHIVILLYIISLFNHNIRPDLMQYKLSIRQEGYYNVPLHKQASDYQGILQLFYSLRVFYCLLQVISVLVS
jgi:hypothetical protein